MRDRVSLSLLWLFLSPINSTLTPLAHTPSLSLLPPPSHYSPSTLLGRVSAGVSCTIDIEFVPKVNEDIYTAIPFYSQTGPGAVPLKCLIRRCAPRVEVPIVVRTRAETMTCLQYTPPSDTPSNTPFNIHLLIYTTIVVSTR